MKKERKKVLDSPSYKGLNKTKTASSSLSLLAVYLFFPISFVVTIQHKRSFFHPHFFHLCNIKIFICFIVSALCCNILALNISTTFAFLHPSFPLPLQQIH